MECSSSACMTTSSSMDMVTCQGICGKSFYACCTGLNKRSLPHFRDYSSIFAYLCEECKEITLSHVLLAIKCSNELITSNVCHLRAMDKKTADRMNNVDLIQKSVQDVHSVLEINTSLVKSNFLKLEKDLKEVRSSIAGLIDEGCASIASELRSLRNKSSTLQDLEDSMSSLRKKLSDHVTASTSILNRLSSNSTPAPTHHNIPSQSPIVDATNRVRDAATDLLFVRRVFSDIAEDVRVASASLTLPLMPPSSTGCPTLQAELSDTSVTPVIALPAPVEVIANPHNQPTPPAVVSCPVISKFGTS